jgi:hypothetical protein
LIFYDKFEKLKRIYHEKFKAFSLLLFCSLVVIGSLNAQTKAKAKTKTPTSTPAPVEPISGIFSHYSQKEIIVGMNNPSVLANYIVYQQDGIYVRGYYGWAAQGTQDVYFAGIRKGNIFYGKSYEFYDKSDKNFKMTFSGNSVTVYPPF